MFEVSDRVLMDYRASPQIKSQHLLEKRVDVMDITDLQEHFIELKSVLIGLVESAASLMLSGPARYQVAHLIKKVMARLELVLWLIDQQNTAEDCAEESRDAATADHLPPRSWMPP